ncbi:hypothetical protein [Pseudocolwellia agarivorans]|uniref:hypothetical protein n=1 Tax=Pseudocolwellia agarivorans TaxID=1911682 RepID=UPI000987311A|nr:hypothetical protein [Pseudocolwellia agarivorans]
MKYVFILLLLSFISIGSFAKEDVSSKQELFITQLINQQTKQQISLRKSISSILTRYPEQIDKVLNSALTLHPEEYEQIMLGALDAEPVNACNVVEHFLNNDIASSTELVKIVVEAEPAYAQEILNTAALHDPDNLEQLVRVTIQTEPLHPRAILSNTMTSFPDRMVDVLSGLIKAIPEKVSKWVSYTFLLFPDSGEQIVTTAISSTNSQHNQAIVKAAIDAGLAKDLALSAAIDGGAKMASINQEE